MQTNEKIKVVTTPSGVTMYLNKDGHPHRSDGPAIIYKDGSERWCINGILHRTNGPAVIDANGLRQHYLNGQYEVRYEISLYFKDSEINTSLNEQSYTNERFKKISLNDAGLKKIAKKYLINQVSDKVFGDLSDISLISTNFDQNPILIKQAIKRYYLLLIHHKDGLELKFEDVTKIEMLLGLKSKAF